MDYQKFQAMIANGESREDQTVIYRTGHGSERHEETETGITVSNIFECRGLTHGRCFLEGMSRGLRLVNENTWRIHN